MVQRVGVKDRNDLSRIGNSAVIVNTNRKAYTEYIRHKKIIAAKDAKINDLERRMVFLESLILNK